MTRVIRITAIGLVTAAPVFAGTATFTSVGGAQPGTNVYELYSTQVGEEPAVFNITLQATTLSSFTGIDVVVGWQQPNPMSFEYDSQFVSTNGRTPASERQVPPGPWQNETIYATDLYLGGWQHTAFGPSVAFGRLELDTAGLVVGEYQVSIDTSQDGVSTFSISMDREGFSGAGIVRVLAACPCIYDLDGSCRVASGDFGRFAPCFGSEETGPGEACEGSDFDCSGRVTSTDFGRFAGAFGTDCDEFDASTYPACKACDGPVGCVSRAARSPASRSSTSDPAATTGGTLEGATSATTPMAEGVVELSVRLTRQPADQEQLGRLMRPALGQLRAGEHVFAEVWANDQTAGSRGLAAVFTDVSFDPGQFQVVGVQPGGTFTLLSDPTIDQSSGVVYRAGGATLEPNRGVGHWVRVALVELVAQSDLNRPEVSVRPAADEPIAGVGRGLIPAKQVRVRSVQ